jgi:hypothetical protein
MHSKVAEGSSNQSKLGDVRAWLKKLTFRAEPLNEGCHGMAASVRVRFAECFLAISAAVLAYLVAEAAFSLVGLRYIPLRLHGDLPEDVGVFAQSSKSGVVPRDPVLLLGDSYAQGEGDSAHVINRLIGRDVVTLGVAGAGSAEGIAAIPAMAYADSKDAWYLIA